MIKVTRCTHIFNEKIFSANLISLNKFSEESGAKVLLALKGYNPFHSSELISKYLTGVAASSLYEVKLAKKLYKGELHTYCPAYDEDTFDEIVKYSTHIVFNSQEDLARFSSRVPSNVKIDLRVNIEYESEELDMFEGYNPNLPYSRFGVKSSQLSLETLEKYNVTGLHFHSLNSQGSHVLEDVVETLIERFESALSKVNRINIGGGHKVCHQNYNWTLLSEIVTNLQNRFNLEVYMEPSQYIFNNVGVLKSKVLSIVENKEKIAILDVSAKNHMPDILECPSYFPEIKNSTLGNTELGHNYILGGPTCLSGDVMGKYSFDKPLKVGDIITFKNQTAYTSIQSMYFNGVSKPDLIVLDEQENLKLHQSDSFEHYLTSVLRPPVSNIHHNQSPPPQAASYPVNKSYMTLLDVLN